jgi:ADP-heptose:LPS heptosyltransferase
MAMKRWFDLIPNKPIPLPRNVAVDVINRYNTVKACDNPEDYINKSELKQLVIRDGGIGDLLLLEPILRKLSERRTVYTLSMSPDVLNGNPHIEENYYQDKKENISAVKVSDFELSEDLRNWSETAQSRKRKHRTDVYNEKFKVELTDAEKEPRIYLSKNEKSILNKKSDKRYIGIQVDASHNYRKYEDGKKLIEHILKQDNKNIVVLLGSKKDIDIKNSRVIDYQGKTTIREAMNIIKDLDYMIAVDSGLMHIALTYHVPTVCIFSIITPELRLKYYTGEYRVIQKDIECIGCGNYHMVVCKYGDKRKDDKFKPPCMDLDVEKIYLKMIDMKQNKNKRIYKSKTRKTVTTPKPVNIIPHGKNKIVLPLIVQNEEHNLPRFIENVIKHKTIGRVIAIDGGSTDKTVELLEKAGAYVYTHKYDKTYHDMQAMQRNYSFSFVKDGERALFMDIDECFSNELSDYLPELANSNIEFAEISRRTYKYYADINDNRKRIKDYPDWQPRYYIWNKKYKFVGSPHHQTLNTPPPVKIQKDIIHFEREGKDRDALEKQWANMQKKTIEIYR